MQMSGMLKTFPPAELLQWAQNDRLTGTLVLRRSRREKRILFKAGKVVGCLSNEPFEFYGRYLLAGGNISESDLLRGLSICEESEGRIRLGEALIALGVLGDATLKATLRQQVEQSIIDTFLWPRGVFFLLDDVPVRAALEDAPIEPIGLVLEGVHQVDEIGRIRSRLPHDSVILKTGEFWPGVELAPLAQRIITVFEPDLTLRRLHETVGGGFCQFLTAVDQLLQDGVVEIDRFEEPTTDTIALSLLDVMLDRVQGQRDATIGATVEVPISALGSLYPLRIGELQEGVLRDAPTAVRELAQGLDGQHRLGGLLSSELKAREAQLEWLWLQLGARKLVLLPYAANDEIANELERAAP